MKTKKMLRKIGALLNADQCAQIAKFDSLEKVLGKLRLREEALREKLDKEEDEERRREILRKLEVVSVQRQKGLELRKNIEDLRESE